MLLDDNKYLNVVNDIKKNNVVVEYALKNMSKPIGVSEYKLTHYLPEEFEKSLPSTQDIESRIKECLDTTEEDE